MSNHQQKICLFGGTFDPIHLGHTFIAERVTREYNFDKIIFLPCRQSPHKEAEQAASPDDRLRMCELATDSLEWAEVSDFDLSSPPPSYSWRTAEHFSKMYPDAQLYWLMGTDQWRSLDRWARVDYFRSLVNIMVYSRDAEQLTGIENSDRFLSDIIHPASATKIRKQLSLGRSSSWLHPLVSQYCKENALYPKSQLD